MKPDDLWKETKLLARRGGIRARETAAGQGEAQAGAFDVDVSRNAHAGNVVIRRAERLAHHALVAREGAGGDDDGLGVDGQQAAVFPSV